MVNLTETQEEAVASIALAAKNFTTCATALMNRVGLDKLEGFQLIIYINPELTSEEGSIIFGNFDNKEDQFGHACLRKEVGKNEYRKNRANSKELERIFAEYNV